MSEGTDRQEGSTFTFCNEICMASASSHHRRVVLRRVALTWKQRLLRICLLLTVGLMTVTTLCRSIRSLLQTYSIIGVQEAHKRSNLRGGGGFHVWINSDSQLFNEGLVASHATNLIIVADYQRNKGLPQAIVSHIQGGIKLALKDERSLLVFSGGETRAQTGPDSEGASYFRVADALELWDGRDVSLDKEDVNLSTTLMKTTVRARTITEEYATDSFENLMFSICRFHEITGIYPQKVSVVSFSFKQERFETLHAVALRWPLSRFEFVGIDPPSWTGFDLQQSFEGEKRNSLLPYTTDPYGCHSEVLQAKRTKRNPFARKAPYEITCPKMVDILKWCGPSLIPKNNVPWSS